MGLHVPTFLAAGSFALFVLMSVVAERSRPATIISVGILSSSMAVATSIVAWSMRPGEGYGIAFCFGLCIALVAVVLTAALSAEAHKNPQVPRAEQIQRDSAVRKLLRRHRQD